MPMSAASSRIANLATAAPFELELRYAEFRSHIVSISSVYNFCPVGIDMRVRERTQLAVNGTVAKGGIRNADRF